MKEYESIDHAGDAAFDEHCRSLLAERVVEAPAPASELFAAHRRPMGYWAMGAAAAGLFIAAGAWFSLSDDGAPHPEPEIQAVQTPEMHDIPVDPSADLSQESHAEWEVSTEVQDVTHPVVVEVPSERVTTASIQEGTESSVPSESNGSFRIHNAPAVETQGEMEVNETVEELLPQSTDAVVDPEGFPDDADGKGSSLETIEQKETEEPTVGAPTLRLPLTLPVGGGKN